MKFVKVKGKDLQDCYMKIRMEYGPDAHIYDHKVIREGGIFGLMSKQFYEVEVGILEKENSQQKIEKKSQELQQLLKQIVESRNSSKTLDKIQPLSKNSNKRKLKTNNTTLENPISFEKEMQNMQIEEKKHPSNKIIVDFKYQLIQRGISKDYCEELIQEIADNFSPAEEFTKVNFIQKVKKVMGERLKTDCNLAENVKNKKKAVFFVGPTGSGKTTTIAKLCAMHHFHLKKNMALYTTDDYRIAAVEQLKKYSDTIGVPFFPVKNKEQMSESLNRDGSQVIFVDTSGYNHKDEDKLKIILNYEDVLKENGFIIEYVLVLPSTLKKNIVKLIMESYEFLNYQKVLITKIDETDFLHPFLELLDIKDKSFSFLSIGQEVPFDILRADSDLLIDLILYPDKIQTLKGKSFD